VEAEKVRTQVAIVWRSHVLNYRRSRSKRFFVSVGRAAFHENDHGHSLAQCLRVKLGHLEITMDFEEEILRLNASQIALRSMLYGLVLAAKRRGIGEEITREALDMADATALRLHGEPSTAEQAGRVLEELEGMREVLLSERPSA
jgi:hypothetical protein